jgi:hypothetical protein
MSCTSESAPTGNQPSKRWSTTRSLLRTSPGAPTVVAFSEPGILVGAFARLCRPWAGSATSRHPAWPARVYGPGAARLHEEIILVTAAWTEAGRGTQPLRPFGEVREEATLVQLDKAFENPSQPAPQ